MYTSDSEITNNVSKGNIIGYAFMFSNRLIIRDNVSDHDRDRGILFNAANSGEITGNTVTANAPDGAATASSGGGSTGNSTVSTISDSLISGNRITATTTSGSASGAPAVPLWSFPAVRISCIAGPATPAAENTTGDDRLILFYDVERPLTSKVMTAVSRWVSTHIVNESASKTRRASASAGSTASSLMSITCGCSASA